MPNLLLSELCAICHIRPHKYRCPRCSARTCSLPCVKRHKQWSQCNGIRDPSTYIKRSDLATPRGIDHDYNYLTSIERQLDSADREASVRGITIHSGTPNESRAWTAKGLNGLKKGEAALRRAIEQCGVVVERAPEGMKRRELNATSWHRNKKVIQWTVEWIHPDGRSEIGSCRANIPPTKAYIASFEAQNRNEDDEARPRKRRKRAAIPKLSQTDVLVIEASTDESTGQVESAALPAPPAAEIQSVLSHQESSLNASFDGHVSPDQDHDNEHLMASLDSVGITRDPEPSQEAIIESNLPQEPTADMLGPLAADDPEGPQPSKTSTEPPSSHFHFYLHAPRLPSPCPVLIPLSPEASLSESLRNRLILEFPTIYVRNNPPDMLGDEHITEEAFFRKMQDEGYRESIEAKLTGNESGEVQEELIRPEHEVDERKLEEVLKKDLTSLQKVF